MTWLSRPASDTQITHGQRLWLYILAVIIMVLLVAPTLIVIPMSFSASQYLEFPPREWSTRWYETYFASPAWMQATKTSLKAGVLTMLLATPLGVAAAYGLHVSRHRFAQAAFVLLITPMMVPVILIAIGAFYAYVQIGMVNSLAGLVVAHAILALPLVLIVVSAALKSYDMNQEAAARSLGASRLMAFLTDPSAKWPDASWKPRVALAGAAPLVAGSTAQSGDAGAPSHAVAQGITLTNGSSAVASLSRPVIPSCPYKESACALETAEKRSPRRSAGTNAPQKEPIAASVSWATAFA
jgi:ABC-type amino acid transport system permease subunit